MDTGRSQLCYFIPPEITRKGYFHRVQDSNIGQKQLILYWYQDQTMNQLPCRAKYKKNLWSDFFAILSFMPARNRVSLTRTHMCITALMKSFLKKSLIKFFLNLLKSFLKFGFYFMLYFLLCFIYDISSLTLFTSWNQTITFGYKTIWKTGC